MAMNSSKASPQWLLLAIFISSALYNVNGFWFKLPRTSLSRGLREHYPRILEQNIPDGFETFFYNQTIDHFNYRPESFTTFRQRYLIYSKHWGGGQAPILAFMGAEEPIDDDLKAIGFLTENSERLKALVVFMEHRYYGQSVPFGSRSEALNNTNNRGYFNSAQALADYAEILLHIKKTHDATYSPVIVVGGSYGGELATWFRLKYPHIALGALASSAPVLYYEDITPHNAYYSIVTKNYRDTSETCYQTILKSWAEIQRVGELPDGASILSRQFKTCTPLRNENELRDALAGMYASTSQYGRPPENPIEKFCSAVDRATACGNDSLCKIAAAVFAQKGDRPCYINKPKNRTETDEGWPWQSCSEMVVPMSIDEKTMLRPVNLFNLTEVIDQCQQEYGVPPRPNWITTYYGGHDIKLTLQRSTGNIIFSNGLRDPYSAGGVLKNISDNIIALPTVNGSHCLDIVKSNKTSDPDWLVQQRKTEVEIIKGWIAKYYADLKAINKWIPFKLQ
ncbi:lysosomal Pro-X carboxypeptidase [Citrus clementina]|uniref:lysosomal Pro-X carboxypeptidase n=1 Tax=Citrus clementina TaxID=85681 RepID=UPI000CED1F54|nr:lysosomal Pro-X carboxypeptidase [Citrus x clementina]